jgi:SAM-dependent methyltransferase
MFSESADVYDLIYSVFKDYSDEADQIAEKVRALHSNARTMLDVACGTGEHARSLADRHGFEVDGIDLDEGMIRVARAKNAGGRFEVADMRDFDLGRQYDVILCLFSSIGYARTLANVRRAFASFRRHLRPRGIALIEPWFPPGVLEVGRISINTADAGPLKVCRMIRTTIEGSVSRLEFQYLIGDATGIRHASEVHELGLFTVQEMTQALQDQGFQVQHDPVGLSGRGLYIARLEG